MKKLLKNLAVLSCIALILVSSTVTAFAHGGRTDGSGGHRDNNNVSGLGSYHYHCGGYSAHLHSGGYCPYTDVMPSGVSLAAEKTTLGIGETITIEANVYPSNACSTRVNWSSSDTSVVTVYSGRITAKAYGTAVITAETINGRTSTMRITVKEITAEKIEVTGLPEADTFYIGDSFQLSAKIIPENVDNPSLVWITSNDKVATVSSTGSVKLLAKGKATISAVASNGVTEDIELDVKEKVVKSVNIATDEIKLYIGEDCTFEPTVEPADATYPELTWTVADPSILSVSNDGTVSALACGTTTVTATAKNGKSDTVTVTVDEIKAKSIAIEGEQMVDVGDTAIMSAVFDPNNTTLKDVEWSVSDTEIATIDKAGKLTALKTGSVIVTATSVHGVTAEYEVTVFSSTYYLLGICGGASAIIAAVIALVVKKKKSK